MNRWSIEYAGTRADLTLCKYEDPISAAREGLTVDEALAIASEDSSLVWVRPSLALVERFRDDAGAAGDEGAVRTCNQAIGGNLAALASVGRMVIDAAGRQ